MRPVATFAMCVLLPALWTTGCDWLSGPKLDTDPNRASSATRDQLLTGVQHVQFSALDAPGDDRLLWMQQITATGRYATSIQQYELGDADFGGAFIQAYGGGGLLDLRAIEASARTDGDRTYLGMARVWEALIIAGLADFFGDVPYSEAASLMPAPRLDSQAMVYRALQALLDSAIVDLASGTSAGPGAIDLVYDGDAARWLAMAHTLKARLYLHTAERDSSAYDRALSEANQGIADSSGDFRTFHSDDPNEQNPWSALGPTGVLTGDFNPGAFLVTLMKRTSDPRLAAYFTKAGDGEYDGAEPGQSFNAGTISILSAVRGGGAFRQPIVTWSETQLIRAEALARAGNDPQARAALDLERRAYGLGDVSASGSALLTQILQEKYIALFQNVEVYNDWKRTCYPNLAPVSDALGGNIPARGLYPEDERNANPNIPPPGAQPARNWNDPVSPAAPDGSPCLGQRF